MSNTSIMLVVNANKKLCKHTNSKSCAEIFSCSKHHGISKLAEIGNLEGIPNCGQYVDVFKASNTKIIVCINN